MNDSVNRRILVVDDNASIHADFHKILGDPSAMQAELADARSAFFGGDEEPAPEVTYEIDSAYQGEEGLAKVGASLACGRPYALVFMDVRMPPGWDGIETLARIFEVDARIQAVICTAYSDHSWDHILARLGRSDRLLILKKPFDNVEVQQLASALTEKWNAEARERARIEEARTAEREARAYASSLATMNRALEAARATAVSAAQAKSEFLTNMSHEIRTPMIAILGAVELLREGPLLDAERDHQLDSIRGEGRHLLTMLSDILDLSALESGRLLVEKRDCSPRSLLAAVVAEHQTLAHRKGLELAVECGASVPESLRTDPTRLGQILAHLVSNAIKFTDSGVVRLSCDMESALGGAPRLQVVVADTGIGITAEQRHRLFEVFSPGDGSLTRRHGGAGLGLALSRRLAHVLGGELDVESASGAGSCFTLSLPCPAESGPAVSTAAGGAAKESLSGRILLVEDTLSTQRLYELYLQRAGASVDVASNGAEGAERALAALGAGRAYDVVLMDMQMPVLDGYSATRQLRAAGYAGPIVAVTAHALAGDRDRCIEAGCDDYLAKPVDRERLVAACRDWIGRGVPPALPSGPGAHELSPDAFAGDA
ncbi:MAG: response regulator [Planctomycetota bacterium]|nr:response regulator [Planctomycetota bacterium]